ncbi:fluoride efflux transporter FluC [Streptomyces sp. GSL17-111]|uniref:fluoride efflux transporter FluC n=1 Tax=Streptomyces sp. GSL17-111 TaxID=3121596 RepID=UPI0030F437D7
MSRETAEGRGGPDDAWSVAGAVDPDVDLHVPADRAETAGGRRRAVLAAIALGGAAGGLARYAAVRWWPAGSGEFPAALLGVNVVGCALLGLLMAWIAARDAHPLLRPFLGVGVLGGFTSFSAYALDGTLLFDAGAPGTALAYLAGTLLLSLAAVWAGVTLGRRVLGGGRAAG